jgi:hypothetical protein
MGVECIEENSMISYDVISGALGPKVNGPYKRIEEK